MPADSLQPSLEQTIATLYTCRSILKYNAVLTNGQKEDIFSDIDASLHTLQTFQLTCARGEDTTKPTVPKEEELPVRETGQAHSYTIHMLYQLYHTYLNSGPGWGIETFVRRFNDVTVALDRVHSLLEQSSQMVYPSPISVDEPFKYIKEFIADLYCMFMELIRSLSIIVQEHESSTEASTDTEEMGAMIQVRDTGQLSVNLSALIEVYTIHQRLTQGKGVLSRRVSNACACLAFLEERFLEEGNRRDEIIARLGEASNLINDLANILSSYERALASMLNQGS